MGGHNEFGRLGEQLATDFLRKNGYEVQVRNYRYLKAEIDIIAMKGNILAIIEVKSRSSDALQEIAETVNKKKMQLMVMAADHYVISKDMDIDVRFDVITILKTGEEYTITHLKDAFYHF